MIEQDPKLREEVHQFKLEMATFTATVKEWMKTTVDYRLSLCEKLDKVQKSLEDKTERVQARLELLPCAERKSWYQSISRQVGFMWVLLTVYIIVLIGMVFAKQ